MQKPQKETSKKKQQGISVVRNVLSSPFDKFWPLLDSSDNAVLTDQLEKLLPSAAIPKGSFTRKKLKKIFKEKDKAKRKILWKQKDDTMSEESKLQAKNARLNRKSLVLGVNGVARGLEKSQISACLVAGEVTTRLIVNHIISLAAYSGVTVLVVPSLQSTTKKFLGTQCLTLGLHKQAVEENNQFHPLYETIVNLGKKFTVPHHFNFDKDDAVIVSSKDITKRISRDVTSNLKPDNTSVVNKTLDAPKKFSYLQRRSTKERAFVPKRPSVKLDSSQLLFIPIGKGNKKRNSKVSKFDQLKKEEEEEEEEEEDDDDELIDESDLDNEYVMDTDNIEPKSDILFFIDTKSSSNKSSAKSSKKQVSSVELKPTIVKKIKSNLNKKRKKDSNK